MSTFSILQCETQCTGSSNCVNPSMLKNAPPYAALYDVCVPENLQVQDNDHIYSLDTGSSLATINHCTDKKIRMTDDTFVTSYGSAQNVVDHPISPKTSILNHKIHAVCDEIPLRGTSDGLIGMALAVAPETRPQYGFMSQKTDVKRFVVDKTKTNPIACVGRECEPLSNMAHTHNIAEANTMILPSFEHNSKLYILDTGTTITTPIEDSICIIGNADINQLDVNYDLMEVKFNINEDRVSKICGW